MDGTYSSGEEHILKARKPYTITKQRERWTEEEHNRFLEALKLFGRAWQRIEGGVFNICFAEHIGTKTAVQIRSHAQKFFTKLEKEANVKGIPLGQALDIEIPPPRPKRKPSIPYPRKLVNGGPIPQVGSGNVTSGTSLHSVPLTEDALDLEREPPPEIPSTERFGTEAENHEDVMHVSGTRKPCAFKRFVPNLEEELNSDEVNESYVTVKTKDKQNLHKVDTKLSFQESGRTEKHDILGERDGSNAMHVPVHVADASMEIDAPPVSPHAEYHHDSIMHPSDKAHLKPLTDHSSSLNPNMAYHVSVIRALDEANPKPFMDNSSSAKSNITYDVPFHGFHPNLTPIQNQDEYQSFIQASHTFSNLIVSNLLQNPAAHAAASYAASFWPSCASTCNTGGFPVGSNNAPPSIEAIAAATVASATAWWAANGLFPLYPPFHMGFGYGPSSTYQVPMTKAPDPEFSEARREHHSLKYPALSSPETEQNKVLKNSKELNLNETEQGGGLDTELVEINKPLGVKQVDRSSCGSNETSSSEVDTDGLKQNKNKEELGVHDANGRRARSSGYTSDSWKEVSQEGRLAFSALFSRMTLPQSFSPTNKGKNVIDINHQNSDAIDDDGKVQFDCSSYRNDGMLSYRNDGILINEKVKGRRTGFKPYKRCSLEAKEGSRGLLCVNNSSQDQEKGPNKRICLEGQSLL